MLPVYHIFGYHSITMPELPEVETVARGLRTHIQGKTIKNVVVLEKKKFRGTLAQLKKYVFGKKVTAITRRAKWLILELSSGYGFVIHLKMTGQLLYNDTYLGGHTMNHEKVQTLPNSHTRVIFEFQDTSKLYFQDMRKFGYVELYSKKEIEHYFIQKKLGIEPLDHQFTFNYFHTQLQRHSKTTIKAALLNQSIVAGLGNIYVDDTCWQAKIQPIRKISSLTAAEFKALYQASKKIITEAIKLGGTSFSHYYRVDGTLGQYWQKRKVYGRTGEPCTRCKTPIKKTRCAGRGTHYCPGCQV